MANYRKCDPPRPLDVRFAKAAGSIGQGPPGALGPQGPAGAPGANGTSDALARSPVRVASSANVALFGHYTLQGVALVDGDRVLAPAQSVASAGGVYVVDAAAWTRATDFDSSGECTPGTGGLILEGDYAGGRWTLLTPNVTLGTTPLEFKIEPFLDVLAEDGKAITIVSGVPTPSKITNAVIDNNTLAVSKLAGSVLDAGKVPVVQGDGSIALAVTPPSFAAKTSLGTTLSARPFLRAYDQQVTDDGTNINIQPLARIPRVMIKGVRTDDIVDFEAITPLTQNGFVLVAGDIFEARGQSTAAQNGLYFVGRILNNAAWCYRLTALEELAVDGGLRVFIRSGSTNPGTVQLVTDFTAGTRVQQPLTGLRYTEVDVEDFALASEDMGTNCEPAFRRAQEALGYSGGEIRFRRQTNYKSTSTFMVKRRIGIRGAGSHSPANGTVLEFVACAGIWGHLKFDMRRSCRSVATANITLSGTQTVNGVALIANDRCLVTGQTLAQNNGYYVVQAGAWTRATDFDTSAEADPACRTIVKAGTYAGTAWELTTPDPIVLGTTPLTFTQATVWVGHEDTLAAQVQVSNLTLKQSGTPVNLDTAGGIIARTSFACTDVYITGFSGNGFDFYGSTNAFPASTNNGSQLLRCWAASNGLNGFKFKGADANQSWIIGCNASSNGTRAVADEDWGFYDDSFLGNHFVACQAATNGGSYKAVGASQGGTFTGCYQEMDNFADIAAPNICINCRVGATAADLRPGAVSGGIPGILRSTDVMLLSSWRSTGPVASAPGVSLKCNVNSNILLDFATQAGGGDTGGYVFRWNPSGGDGITNTWNWAHSNNNSRWAAFLTGPSHGRSHSMFGLPHGALIGGPANAFWKLHAVGSTADLPSTSSTVTGSTNRWEGVYATGDVMWNSGFVPGTGLPTYWICTNTAGALTWQAVFLGNEANLSLTNQSAAISSTALLAAPAPGLYEIDYYLCTTTADNVTPATAAQLTIGHTDQAGATSQLGASLATTALGRDRGRMLVEVAGGNVTYAVSWTTPGTARFSLRLRARRVG